MKKIQIFSGILLGFFSFFAIAGDQGPINQQAELSVFEDLLYWHASQQPTSPWAYVQTINSPPGATYTEPNVYFGWSPGLRVGAQYEKPGFFDSRLYWTYFSTKTHEAITAGPNEIIIPEFFNGFTTENFFNAAQLNWKLAMNMIDADIGHRFNPISSLSIRPFVGIKGGTINQSIHSSWQANILNATLYYAEENLKNNFHGIGPSFGINSTWGLYKNLSLRGDFTTALLWGHWNITDNYNRPEALLGFIPQKIVSSNTNNSMLGAFMASYFMGLEWSFQARALVKIKAGYEMQFWSNQLRLPVFQALPIHGDLTLQGATCGISINL